MTLLKQLAPPAFRSRTVRRTISLFSERSGALFARGIHFREEGEDLVCAEGAEQEGKLPAGARLIVSSGHEEKLFRYAEGQLFDPSGAQYGLEEPPAALFAFRPETGGETVYALTESGLFSLGTETKKVDGAPGGACGCLHFERLFTAQGERISWSQPLSPEGRKEGLREAGRLDLPSAGGAIFAMFPRGDVLYLIRERGICALTAKGDPLAFAAEELSFPCGEIVRGSAADCGDIVFLTDNGLYACSDGRIRRIEGVGASLPDRTERMDAASYGGRYFAPVAIGGESCLWVVDPGRGEGHFLRMRADSVAGCGGVHFADGETLYRLTERGMPTYGRRECTLTTERSTLGLSPGIKFVDGILLEGEGSFRAEIFPDRGAPRAVCGRAGSYLRLPAPVRGATFSLHLNTLSEGARVRAVVFRVREERA